MVDKPILATSHGLRHKRISVVCLTLVTLVLLTKPVSLFGDDVTPRDVQSDLPSLTKLGKTASHLLSEQATAKTEAARDAATMALCDLYVVLKSDPRFGTSPMLQGDSAKVRRRLLNIARKRENRLRREGISRNEGLDKRVNRSLDADAAQHNISVKGGRGGAGGDNAWLLIDLIERIVDPDFWESQGGPGSVQYFAMRRVLVVRATTDVHEQLRDLLIALRR